MKNPTRRSALALAAVAALTLTGCGSSDPLGGGDTASGSPSGTGGTGGSGGAETLVIGSQQYYSNEIIAELYAQAQQTVLDGFFILPLYDQQNHYLTRGVEGVRTLHTVGTPTFLDTQLTS